MLVRVLKMPALFSTNACSSVHLLLKQMGIFSLTSLRNSVRLLILIMRMPPPDPLIELSSFSSLFETVNNEKRWEESAEKLSVQYISLLTDFRTSFEERSINFLFTDHSSSDSIIAFCKIILSKCENSPSYSKQRTNFSI